MDVYKYIINPLTGNSIKITSRKGKQVINKYLNQVGGELKEKCSDYGTWGPAYGDREGCFSDNRCSYSDEMCSNSCDLKNYRNIQSCLTDPTCDGYIDNGSARCYPSADDPPYEDETKYIHTKQQFDRIKQSKEDMREEDAGAAAGAGAADQHYPNYLIHGTTLDNLGKIIPSKWLLTSFDLKQLTETPAESDYGRVHGMRSANSEDSCPVQYQGIYMRVIDKEHGLEPEPQQDDNIFMVFDGDLVKRGDFHFNHTDQWGNITDLSMKSPEFLYKLNTPDMCNKIVPDNNEYKSISPCISKNEMIFHHSVPLKYLKEIWLMHSVSRWPTPAIFLQWEKIIRKLLDDNGLNHVNIRKFNTIQGFGQYNDYKKEYEEWPDTIFRYDGDIEQMEPNYCNCIDWGNGGIWDSRDNRHRLNYLAKNCNLELDESLSHDELLEQIRTEMVRSYNAHKLPLATLTEMSGGSQQVYTAKNGAHYVKLANGQTRFVRQ